MAHAQLSDLPTEILHQIISYTLALHDRTRARAHQSYHLALINRRWYKASKINRHFHVGSLAQIRALSASLDAPSGGSPAAAVRRLTLELREEGKGRSKACADLIGKCRELVELGLHLDWAYGALGKFDEGAPDYYGRPLLDALRGLRKLEHFKQPWYSEVCAEKLGPLLAAWPNLITLDLIQLRITDHPCPRNMFLPTKLRSLRFPAGSAGLPLFAALVAGAQDTLRAVDVQYLDSLADAREVMKHLEDVIPQLESLVIWGWRADGAPKDEFLQDAVAKTDALKHLIVPNAGINPATFFDTINDLRELETVEVRTFFGAPLDGWKVGEAERFLRGFREGGRLRRVRVPRQLLEVGAWSREEMDELRQVGRECGVEFELSVF